MPTGTTETRWTEEPVIMEAIPERSVTSRRRVGDMETEIWVEGYDADEAVEIIRALTDGEVPAADP